MKQYGNKRNRTFTKLAVQCCVANVNNAVNAKTLSISNGLCIIELAVVKVAHDNFHLSLFI